MISAPQIQLKPVEFKKDPNLEKHFQEGSEISRESELSKKVIKVEDRDPSNVLESFGSDSAKDKVITTEGKK